MLAMPVTRFVHASPPSRAAWIEILMRKQVRTARASPPSRAAWIEIEQHKNRNYYDSVAAFTGGVD